MSYTCTGVKKEHGFEMDYFEDQKFILPTEISDDIQDTDVELDTSGNNSLLECDTQQKKKKENQKCMCDICGKSFSTTGALILHVKIHVEEKSHICRFCGKAFRRLHQLQAHSRTHTGEKPHKCETCGKTYAEKRSLRLHSYTHSGEQPHFPCEICGKGYFCKFLYNRHMQNIHGTGIAFKKISFRKRSDPCVVCGKTFCDKNTLERHMKIHTGEKERECLLCKKQLRNQHTLNKHMYRKHNPNRDKNTNCLICANCGMMFKTNGGLQRHLLKKHGNLESVDATGDEQIFNQENMKAELGVVVKAKAAENKIEMISQQLQESRQDILSAMHNKDE